MNTKFSKNRKLRNKEEEKRLSSLKMHLGNISKKAEQGSRIAEAVNNGFNMKMIQNAEKRYQKRLKISQNL
jgi:hypothetical protein